MSGPEELRGKIAAAHAEALRVGDSPVRADQLERKLAGLVAAAAHAPVAEDVRSRIRTALESAVRVLRREEDGREAARHLATALGLLEDRPRKASPFPDD